MENRPQPYDAVLGNGNTPLSINKESLLDSMRYNLDVSHKVIQLKNNKLRNLTEYEIRKEGGKKKIESDISYWQGKADAYSEFIKLLEKQ